MTSTKIIETDLHGAIEAVRAGKTVYTDRECVIHVDNHSFTYLIGTRTCSFYYKLECEKREYVETVKECNGDKRVTLFVPDDIPEGTTCYITVEIPVNASSTPEV